MKSPHHKRSKRKHLKQLRRNAKNKHLRIEKVGQARKAKRDLLLEKKENE